MTAASSASWTTYEDSASLRAHLVDTRLAGTVATSPSSTLTNCGRLVEGDDEYTFGLSDWRTATFAEVLAAVERVCGGDPRGADQAGAGWIDPDATVAAIERHRRALADFAANGGRALLATGHPTGLLPHYQAIARALQESGCQLLSPLDDTFMDEADPDSPGWPGRPPRGVRFLDGVAAVFDGGSLRHTHRARYMEAMLDEARGAVDLVLADHGMAGAAIERDLPTLSIADVNDPALPLAQVRGRTDAVLPVDDNLAPRVFTPVTAAILDWP